MLREMRRFLKRNLAMNLTAGILLAAGMGLSSIALDLLISLRSLGSPGLRNISFATISESDNGQSSRPISWNRFERLRGRFETNPSLAAYSTPATVQLQVGGAERPIRIAVTSANFFESFTEPVSVGRTFTTEEEQISGQHVVILSFPIAVALFRSPAQALSHEIKLDGLSYAVVGVAPMQFSGIFGTDVDAWAPASCIIPLSFKLHARTASNFQDLWKVIPGFFAIAGSSRASAPNLVSETAKMLPARAADEQHLQVSQGLTSDPMRDSTLRRWSRLGFLIAIAFTIVAGLNYCGLLLARAPLLIEQIRLKRILGAASPRLMSELIAGPASLMSASFLSSLVILVFGLTRIARISPFFRQLIHGSLNAGIELLAIQICLTAVLTCCVSLLPALRLLKDSGSPRLGYTSTESRRMSWAFGALVTGQIACCIVTCTMVAMIVIAVMNLLREPLGYRPKALVAVRVYPSAGSINWSIDDTGPFPLAVAFASLLNHARSLPGVRKVSAAISVPLDNSMHALSLEKLDGSSAIQYSVDYNGVTQNYFDTLGTKFLRGRGFSSASLTGKANEVVINEALARELWPDADPLNRTVRLSAPALGLEFTCSVIGVVEDMRLNHLNETPQPIVFLPLRGPVFALGMPYAIVARGTPSIRSLENRISSDLAATMPALKAEQGYSIAARIAELRAAESRRGYLALAGAIAIALVAYVGLYAALAFYISTKRRELAVRICFGASSWTIRSIVIRHATVYALLAALISALAWPLLAIFSSRQLVGKTSWSIENAFLVTSVCIVASAMTALISARSATRITPIEMLRDL